MEMMWMGLDWTGSGVTVASFPLGSLGRWYLDHGLGMRRWVWGWHGLLGRDRRQGCNLTLDGGRFWVCVTSMDPGLGRCLSEKVGV